MISVCDNGGWKCDNADCKDVIKCPKNLVFSRNCSACPKTCGNKGHYRDCGIEIEGCRCPEGHVLNYDVNYIFYF